MKWRYGAKVPLSLLPRPPHGKACVSRDCDINARIKFIIDTAIDDLEWKNPMDFGANRNNQNGRRRPFCENMMKKLVHSITHRSTSYRIHNTEYKIYFSYLHTCNALQ